MVCVRIKNPIARLTGSGFADEFQDTLIILTDIQSKWLGTVTIFLM